MKVWLLQPSEILPINDNKRLMRMGLLAEQLTKDEKNDVTWFTGTFNHFEKYQTTKKAKLKSRTRKGIPDSLRSQVWQIFAGTEKFYQKNCFAYQKIPHLNMKHWKFFHLN